MELPSYLIGAWRLEHDAEAKARNTKQLKGWTASSLAEAHMKYQLDKHYQPNFKRYLPTLATIAVGKTLEVCVYPGPCPNLNIKEGTESENIASCRLCRPSYRCKNCDG